MHSRLLDIAHGLYRAGQFAFQCPPVVDFLNEISYTDINLVEYLVTHPGGSRQAFSGQSQPGFRDFVGRDEDYRTVLLYFIRNLFSFQFHDNIGRIIFIQPGIEHFVLGPLSPDQQSDHADNRDESNTHHAESLVGAQSCPDLPGLGQKILKEFVHLAAFSCVCW